MSAIEVVRPGMLTTVQDWPGRIGYWHVGVPPSGPMDDLSFRIGNRVLGNPEGAAGLECTRGGPALRFPDGGRVCVTGAPVVVTLDGTPVPQWQSIACVLLSTGRAFVVKNDGSIGRRRSGTTGLRRA